MRRRAALLCGAILAGLLGACGNTPEGLWIQVKEDSVTPTGVEIVFQNTTERGDFVYGSQYELEKKEGEGWRGVAALPGASVGGPSIDLHIPTRSEIEEGWPEEDLDPDSALPWFRYPPNEMGYDWTDRYGPLPAGEYRIVIAAEAPGDSPSPPGAEEFYLAAEFTVE